jgi:hypothetical protein
MQLTVAQARAIGIKLPVKPRRPKKPPAPDSYIPHDCVILAIDPGKTSGWAISGPPVQHRRATVSGESPAGWTGAICMAIEWAQDAKRPLIVVAETWTTGDRIHDRRARAAMLLGLGAAWGQWKAGLDLVGLPRSRVVRVNVGTWRAKVIGGPMARSSEEWKAAAQQVAGHHFPEQRLQPDMAPGASRRGNGEIGPDEAEALCILRWSFYAGAVGVAVKKAGRRYP